MLVTSSTEIDQVGIESRVCEMVTRAKMNRAVGFGWVQGREFFFLSFFSSGRTSCARLSVSSSVLIPSWKWTGCGESRFICNVGRPVISTHQKCLNDVESSLIWIVESARNCAVRLAVSMEYIRYGEWVETVEHDFFPCSVVRPLCRSLKASWSACYTESVSSLTQSL